MFATCVLGIGTVAVYTDPDAGSPHVAEADARCGSRAQRLPGRKAMIDAARTAGADAIHPGYGFLSENAEFAAAVQDAGLTWIGPPVAAVAAMGSKIEAKKMMAGGVPVLEELDPDAVTADQLPVLIKASAGGGGRGMRVVRELVRCHRKCRPRAARRSPRSAIRPCSASATSPPDTTSRSRCSPTSTAPCGRRRARMLDPAAPPEDHRGGAVAARRAHCRSMRAKLFDAARLAATAIGYTGRAPSSSWPTTAATSSSWR